MFILLNYLFAIPVSLLGAIITKLLRPSVMLKEISMYLGFYRNMLIMLVKYTPKIISGKPYFYKVL
jgi:hypothetical protein